MNAIELLGVNPIELTHAFREIPFNRFHNNMIVVGHLAPSMAYPIESFTYITKYFQPGLAIRNAKVNILTVITTRGHMIEAARQFYS